MSATILIVEDEPDMRFLLRLALDRGGFRILEAETGEMALTLLSEEEPDLVLLDLNLPGIDGFEVVDQMRDGGMLERMRVLMLSADSRPDLESTAVEKGCLGFLVKPVSPNELVARIESELAQRESPAG